MSDILETKIIEKNGFIIRVDLIADYQSGFTQFNDKWERSQEGLVTCDSGDKWNCCWYSIGQLNKGNDVTVYQAQKEFNRDCNAFDTLLNVTVSKSDIELIDQVIIGSDYSFDDEYTSEQSINELMNDYLDVDYLINEAQAKINKLTYEV